MNGDKFAFDDPASPVAFDDDLADEANTVSKTAQQAQQQFEETRSFRNYLQHVASGEKKQTRYSPTSIM
jgi:hypothetical protein